MSGRIVNVMPRRHFDFGGLISAGSITSTVVQRCDVSRYGKVEMVVRVHDLTKDAGTTLQVIAYTDAHTSEQPGTYFLGSTALGTVTIADNDPAGTVHVAELSSPFGGMIAIVVYALQNNNDDDINADLSIDLVLTECC